MSGKFFTRRQFGYQSVATPASLLLLQSRTEAREKKPELPPVLPPRYGLSTKEYILKQLESAPRSLSFDKAELPTREWQLKLRARLLSLLDLDSVDFNIPDVRIESTVAKRGFTETKLHYQVDKNLWCPAILLTPENARGRLPAVLACHGHGTGVRFPIYTYIEGFARRGYIVFAPDVRDFGERAYEKRGPHECFHLEPMYNLLGHSSMGLKIKDLLLGLAWMRAQKNIDPERIGCGGLSMGGGLSLFLSAIQPRIAVSVVSGFLTNYKSAFVDKPGMCPGYVVHGILNYCDLYDVAGLIAPRPLVIESGRQDKWSVHEEVLSAHEKARQIYKAFGAENRIVMDAFDGRHEFNGKIAYPWFDTFLKN